MAASLSALAVADDLEDMWRPLTDDEKPRIARLLVKASALLRQAAPHVDARVAQFYEDPTVVGALDPVTVATVVATIVKRFISNVEGVASETVGPYHVAYALRQEKDIRGELQITENDLKALRPYQPKAAIGSIRVRPALAPWPFGRIGGFGGGFLSPGQVDGLLIEEGFDTGVVEVPVPFGAQDGVW